jgi:hypothetical protein
MGVINNTTMASLNLTKHQSDQPGDPDNNKPITGLEIFLGIFFVILIMAIGGSLIYAWRYQKQAKTWFGKRWQKVRGKAESKDIEAQPRPTEMAPVPVPAPVRISKNHFPRAAPPARPHPGPSNDNPSTAPENEMKDVDLDTPSRDVEYTPPRSNWI